MDSRQQTGPQLPGPINLLNAFTRQLHARVVPLHVRDLTVDPVLRRGAGHRLAVSQTGRRRLFQKDVLAGVHRLRRDRYVRRRTHDCHDGVAIDLVDHFAIVGEAAINVMLSSDGLRETAPDVTDSNDPAISKPGEVA